jgi:benzoate/toluate 1,2-dioxygenase beta subunit
VTGLFERLAAETERFRRMPAAEDVRLAESVSLRLFHEARLLDDGRLLEWLDLCTDDIVYWIPANHEGGDPRSEVSIVLDDRRRLEDRVHWVLGGRSHAQRPPSRTIRHVSNVEAWALDDGDCLSRSTLVVDELRGESPRRLVGAVEHVWNVQVGVWRIRRKRVHLLDSDRHRWNATFIL